MTDGAAGSNTNTLSAQNFIFLLSSNKLKDVEFRVQSFSGLGISLGENVRYWNSLQFTAPGDSMIFNDLTLSVLVDENMNVIETLYDYVFRIKDFTGNELSTDEWTGTLFTSDNRNNYSKKFTFNDCWIKSFSDLAFSSVETSADPLTIDLTVAYSYYTIADTE